MFSNCFNVGAAPVCSQGLFQALPLEELMTFSSVYSVPGYFFVLWKFCFCIHLTLCALICPFHLAGCPGFYCLFWARVKWDVLSITQGMSCPSAGYSVWSPRKCHTWSFSCLCWDLETPQQQLRVPEHEGFSKLLSRPYTPFCPVLPRLGSLRENDEVLLNFLLPEWSLGSCAARESSVTFCGCHSQMYGMDLYLFLIVLIFFYCWLARQPTSGLHAVWGWEPRGRSHTGDRQVSAERLQCTVSTLFTRLD